MNIKESVLEFLYKNNNNGRQTNLYPVLLPFDSDRQGIRGTLFNLEKDGFIEIDNDYQKLVFQSALAPIPLINIDLLARLTPKGDSYYKKHYSSLPSKDKTTKFEIKAATIKLIQKVIMGIVITVIGGLILYYILN